MNLPEYKIIGVQVYLEGKDKRLFVGTLKKVENQFYFEYDKKYLRNKNKISLGPEMPLSRRSFTSDTLFIPFEERFPLRENPAYPDYCATMGISVDETDPFIRLTTIARRGPSSFIFEPLYEESFTGKDLLAFRKALGLTVREFASCFDFSPAAINRAERSVSSGRDVLKRAEIYARFPEVALHHIKYHSKLLPTKQLLHVQAVLKILLSEKAKG